MNATPIFLISALQEGAKLNVLCLFQYFGKNPKTEFEPLQMQKPQEQKQTFKKKLQLIFLCLQFFLELQFSNIASVFFSICTKRSNSSGDIKIIKNSFIQSISQIIFKNMLT